MLRHNRKQQNWACLFLSQKCCRLIIKSFFFETELRAPVNRVCLIKLLTGWVGLSLQPSSLRPPGEARCLFSPHQHKASFLSPLLRPGHQTGNPTKDQGSSHRAAEARRRARSVQAGDTLSPPHPADTPRTPPASVTGIQGSRARAFRPRAGGEASPVLCGGNHPGLSPGNLAVRRRPWPSPAPEPPLPLAPG